MKASLNFEEAIPIKEDLPPDLLPMASFRLALLKLGILDLVDDYIKECGTQEEIILWEYSTHVSINDPTVQKISKALNLTEQQIKEVFNKGNI